MERQDHSVVLCKRTSMGGWEYAKDHKGNTIVIDDLTLERIAWLNTTCKAEYKWQSND